jgi:hypothetical protein
MPSHRGTTARYFNRRRSEEPAMWPADRLLRGDLHRSVDRPASTAGTTAMAQE